MVIKIENTGTKVRVTRNGVEVGRASSVNIDGCDIVIPSRGKTTVYGAETWWMDGDTLVISDKKRGGPGDGRDNTIGGFGGDFI